MSRDDLANTVAERLHNTYPDARYELEFGTPEQLLVATILAAQCTDERVNAVTRTLFKDYPDARSYAEADLTQLEEAVRPTGFYRQKAKAIQGACRALVQKHGGRLPRDMDQLVQLPGVARKTANVVLNTAFGQASGVIVDTHVARVSRRLGLTDSDDPDTIERDLMRLLPRDEWVHFGAAMVLHGRYTCKANSPRCGSCMLADVCPSAVTDSADEKPARTKKAKPNTRSDDHQDPQENTAMQSMECPAGWREVLKDEFSKPYFQELQQFVAAERAAHQVFPPEEDVFNALKATPFDEVKVLLLGQDPYHDVGQAHGMCFSVRPGVKPPPSLVNMFKELRDDLGCPIPKHGYLQAWAEQGILLLNAVLTVRAHTPNSHKDRGWEKFTDAVIHKLSERNDPVVFVLWGAYAQKKEKIIDGSRHPILKAAHPSPLSAKKFFGSRPFSAVNNELKKLGKQPIDWELPPV